MELPTPNEHEYRVYTEHKDMGLSSADATERSRQSAENLILVYAFGLKLTGLLGASIGFALLFTPAVEAMSGAERTSVMGTAITMAILIGIIFPIKAQNKVFWILYSVILALTLFLALSWLLT